MMHLAIAASATYVCSLLSLPSSMGQSQYQRLHMQSLMLALTRIFFANAPEIELSVDQNILGLPLNLDWVKVAFACTRAVSLDDRPG